MNLNIPKKFNFAGELVEVDYLVQVFEIPRRTAFKWLKVLRIKPMYIKDKAYFSLPTLKRILFVLSLPSSPGFLFPGSAAKNSTRLLNDKNYISEVTDEILAKAEDPTILAQMMAVEGRDSSIIKKFVTPPQGRPRKDKE
jgi:hypothetical protein